MRDSNVHDACPIFETAILDYFDGTLNEPERRRVEIHMASCAACQAFWQEQKKVDALLSAGLRQPGLPLDFKHHMIKRATADRMESAARTRAAVDLDAEHDGALTRMRKTWPEAAVLSLLDGLGVLTVATVAAMFGYELLTRSTLFSSLSLQQVSVYSATAVGFAGLLAGVWFAFKERIRSVLEAE